MFRSRGACWSGMLFLSLEDVISRGHQRIAVQFIGQIVALKCSYRPRDSATVPHAALSAAELDALRLVPLSDQRRTIPRSPPQCWRQRGGIYNLQWLRRQLIREPSQLRWTRWAFCENGAGLTKPEARRATLKSTRRMRCVVKTWSA